MSTISTLEKPIHIQSVPILTQLSKRKTNFNAAKGVGISRPKLGELNSRTRRFKTCFDSHECHMLKINVQLCILLLLHLFSSVHIGPYNCFFSSMNKSKLNLKMNFIWRKRRINFDSVYQIVYVRIVRSSSDSLSL